MIQLLFCDIRSNIVASSSSLDSTNDSLSQVTLEQENSLLKGRIKVLVLNESSMPMELSGKKINTPKTKFVPQQEKYPTSFKGTQAQDDLLHVD